MIHVSRRTFGKPRRANLPRITDGNGPLCGAPDDEEHDSFIEATCPSCIALLHPKDRIARERILTAIVVSALFCGLAPPLPFGWGLRQ